MTLTITDNVLAFLVACSIFVNLAGVSYLWQYGFWFFYILGAIGFVSQMVICFIVIIATEPG